jgi:hypothetical protein
MLSVGFFRLAVDVAALLALGAWNILGFKKNSF